MYTDVRFTTVTDKAKRLRHIVLSKETNVKQRTELEGPWEVEVEIEMVTDLWEEELLAGGLGACLCLPTLNKLVNHIHSDVFEEYSVVIQWCHKQIEDAGFSFLVIPIPRTQIVKPTKR